MKKSAPACITGFFFLMAFLSVFSWAAGARGAELPAQVSPQQAQALQKAVQGGDVSPETAAKVMEKARQGTLTPEEIKMGKRLLEQKKSQAEKKPAPSAKKKETVKPAPAEQKPQPKVAKSIVPDEEFLKKTFGPKAPSLPIFGHKLFSSSPSTFAPIKTLPVSENYVVGPGDEIRVFMWGRIDASYSLVVDNRGEINFPKIGPLTVAGITFGELKELIKAKAEAITGVNVNVSMGKLRTIQVFVLGEVKSPGVYTVSSLATMSNALLASGGPTALGSLRKVQLRRKGKLVTTLDLYDFLLRGDTSGDTRITPGDVIFVPQCGAMVMVSGNVKRPAIYELKGRRDLKTALRLAGGLKPQALNQRIQIVRAFKNRMQVILDISYDELRGKGAIPLQDGDLIRVFSIMPSAVNAVYLYGNVLRPGQYAWKQGLRIRDILPDLEALDVDTYFDYALIKRYHHEKMRAELIPFDLGGLLLSGDSSQNIALEPLDEIYIFNKKMFEDRPSVGVRGEVRRPGRYYIDNMRIRDLILKAGDLTDDAYLSKGELIRIDKKRNKHTLYFDVAAAMADKPEHNIRIQDEDQVIIHSIWEEKWKESVSIEGQVKKPGTFVLTQGMRIRDLLFKAGRFTRDAYMEKAHLYRTDWRTKEVTILTFNPGAALRGDPGSNLLLKDLDRVVIHNIREYVPPEKITISGQVNRPGAYPYARNMRVRDLVLVARNVTRDAYLEKAHLYRTDWRTKEVTILTFNLKKALAGDAANNLPLQGLDKVVVHSIWEYVNKYTVAIKGMVNHPGEYPYATNMTARDLILVAGNVTDAAHLEAAELIRYDIVGGKRVKTSILNFDVRLALKGDPAENIRLQPLDVIHIKKIPDWGVAKTVTVSGEVLFPGAYQIREGERLSDVIERAGGYTPEAYLRGAVFTRESVRATQQQRIKEMMDRLETEIASHGVQEAQTALSKEDLAAQAQFLAAKRALLTNLRKARATGRVVISLLPVNVLKATSSDLVLKNGDTLFVPKTPDTVNVLGAVYNPTALVYEKDRPRAKHYLALVGGPTKNADTDNMYIVRADGTVVSKEGHTWFGISWNSEKDRWGFWGRVEDTKLYPGDTLLVPQKVIEVSFMRNLKDYSQVLYQLAIAAGVLVGPVF